MHAQDQLTFRDFTNWLARKTRVVDSLSPKTTMGAEHEMTAILKTITTGAVAFAATNLDDLFILTLLFSQTVSGIQRLKIVAGQFLGFSVLIGISMVGFFGGRLLPGVWVRLLGIVPVIIGIRRWIRRNDPPSAHPEPGAVSVFGVAAITFAAGGDNIGVYAPLFSACNGARLLVMLVTFYALLAAWCGMGKAISTHPGLAPVFAQRGRFIVPFVLIGLGAYLLVFNGVLKLFRF